MSLLLSSFSIHTKQGLNRESWHKRIDQYVISSIYEVRAPYLCVKFHYSFIINESDKDYHYSCNI